MPVQTAKILLADKNATVGQLLDALTWLAKDVAQLRDRKKWIDESASREAVVDINNQITEEIKDVEELMDLLKSKIESKCTN